MPISTLGTNIRNPKYSHNDLAIAETDSKRSLSSKWGSIRVFGSPENKETFADATAYENIELVYAAIRGKILSEWGSVSASHSSLGKVAAYHDISLINSSASELTSKWGSVTVVDTGFSSKSGYIGWMQSCVSSLFSKLGFSSTNSLPVKLWEMSSISAYKEVKVERVFVDGRIESIWEHISANQSKLGRLNAYKDIDLVDSSATDLHSKWGNITVRQTDGERRSISHVSAYGKVFVRNCDMKDVVCSQEAVILDSSIENLTLHVNPCQKTVLDLTNTEVLGKIVLKFDSVAFRTIKACGKVLGFQEGQLSIFIKEKEVPKNLSFEGFESVELTTEKTSQGILITGYVHFTH